MRRVSFLFPSWNPLARSALCGFSLLLSWGCGQSGAPPAQDQPGQRSSALGTVHASFAADVFDGDVVTVRIDILHAGTVTATQTVHPAAPDAGIQVLDAYFVVAPGDYTVVVTPLNADGQQS